MTAVSLWGVSRDCREDRSVTAPARPGGPPRLGQREGRRPARVLLGVVLAALCTACGLGETTVPPHLQGMWTTDAPRYGDRYMELRSRHVLFGVRDGNVEVYTVQRVEQTIEDDKDLYTISYGDDEGPDFNLSFYHGVNGRGEIVFKHQPHLRWTRTGS